MCDHKEFDNRTGTPNRIILNRREQPFFEKKNSATQAKNNSYSLETRKPK